jgi:hypothetical protein
LAGIVLAALLLYVLLVHWSWRALEARRLEANDKTLVWAEAQRA